MTFTPEMQSSFIKRSSNIILNTKKKNHKTTLMDTGEHLKKIFFIYFEVQTEEER